MSNAEPADSEGPLLVAARTPGNRRFGALVKDLRQRSGLTPQELAEQAGVHVSFINGIERGAQAPSVATARTLLARMEGQDRIQWRDSGPYDLLVRDLVTDVDVAFDFKAKVKGQNRRTDVDQIRRGKEFAERFLRERGGDVLPRWAAPADDAAFGRVVRLLVAADEEMLARVESLLSAELGSGQSRS